MAFSHLANAPEAICRSFKENHELLTTPLPREAIPLEPLNEWLPGQQPRSRLYCAVTDHTIAYPACAASKKKMAIASPYFLATKNSKAKLPKAQRIVQDVGGSCIAVTAYLCIIYSD